MTDRREFLRATVATLGLAAANTSMGFATWINAPIRVDSLGFIAGGTPLDTTLCNGITASLGPGAEVEVMDLLTQGANPSFRSIVTALERWSGRQAMAVLQAGQRDMFEEALFEVRARLLFRSHHVSDGLSAVVCHDVLELPASRGMAAVLEGGPGWPGRLARAAGLVATSRWSGHLPTSLRRADEPFLPSGPYALSTYVVTL